MHYTIQNHAPKVFPWLLRVDNITMLLPTHSSCGLEGTVRGSLNFQASGWLDHAQYLIFLASLTLEDGRNSTYSNSLLLCSLLVLCMPSEAPFCDQLLRQWLINSASYLKHWLVFSLLPMGQIWSMWPWHLAHGVLGPEISQRRTGVSVNHCSFQSHGN